jgi:hypothetical protein
MSLHHVINALKIPPQARIDQRIPKLRLIEFGAKTPTDKRLIQNSINELFWTAALKPYNIGVPEYHDEVRSYTEIAVLTVDIRDHKNLERLIDIVHRAIPYPTLLAGQFSEQFFLSLAHKRSALNQSSSVVIDDTAFTAICNVSEVTSFPTASMLESLSLASIRCKSLYDLYSYWWNLALTLQVARLTGKFDPAQSAQAIEHRKESLARYEKIKTHIDSLRSQASRERIMSRRVTINQQLKLLEHEQALLFKQL